MSNKAVVKGGGLSAEDISLFCGQVALILRSAVPLEEGVAALGEDAADEKGRGLIKQIADALDDNSSLYDALSKTGVFPRYLLHMVKVGEMSGRLENIMQELSDYYERESRLKKNLTGAIMYPFILVIMMTVVISVLVIKVVPIFRQVLQGFGANISGSAAVMMNAGDVIGKCALLVAALLLIGLAVLMVIMRNHSGIDKLQQGLSHLGFTKKLAKKISAARFASVMNTMYVSGYHAEEALELAADVIDDKDLKEKVLECRNLAEKGESFASALAKMDLFQGIYARMIGIGFKTGNIDVVMKKLADVYQEEAEDSINGLVAVIEPALVGVLTVVIGAILLSVMLPLIGILSVVGA